MPSPFPHSIISACSSIMSNWRKSRRVNGGGRDFSLRNPAGAVDRTLLSLVNAVAGTGHIGNLKRLYIGHVTSAMMTHIVSVYGGQAACAGGNWCPRLSARHWKTPGDRVHGSYGSRKTFPSKRWQLRVRDIGGTLHQEEPSAKAPDGFYAAPMGFAHRRVELARKALLRKGLDIAYRENACGFADQGVPFQRGSLQEDETGIATPAKWRRQ